MEWVSIIAAAISCVACWFSWVQAKEAKKGNKLQERAINNAIQQNKKNLIQEIIKKVNQAWDKNGQPRTVFENCLRNNYNDLTHDDWDSIWNTVYSNRNKQPKESAIEIIKIMKSRGAL